MNTQNFDNLDQLKAQDSGLRARKPLINTQPFNNSDRLSAQSSQLTARCLSPRETEIVHLLAYEYSTKQIAHLLYVSFDTIKTHRKNIQYKLGAKNVAGIVRVAFQSGILMVEESIEVAV